MLSNYGAFNNSRFRKPPNVPVPFPISSKGRTWGRYRVSASFDFEHWPASAAARAARMAAISAGPSPPLPKAANVPPSCGWPISDC